MEAKAATGGRAATDEVRLMASTVDGPTTYVAMTEAIPVS